ncbi:MAG: ATP synthase subunit C [Defluviitaleaceae bacterium]|nr:ATP synthase subunit C [Defluviitaleaceae bacterium]
MIIILALVPFIIFAPFFIYKFSKNIKKSHIKKILFINILSFFGVLIYTSFFMAVQVNANTVNGVTTERGMAFLAAALVTGMCTIGTGIATGQAASAGLGAISENEKLWSKALIFVGLAEGIAVYGLLIAFTILAQI